MPKRSTFLLALLLAGCSMQPKYVQPALPTAPQYPAYAGVGSRGPARSGRRMAQLLPRSRACRR